MRPWHIIIPSILAAPLSSLESLDSLSLLKDSRSRLETEISSLMTSLKKYGPNLDTPEEIFLIPHALLSAEGFQKLGLNKLVNESHQISFHLGEQTRNILIPDLSKNLFLLQSKEEVNIPEIKSKYGSMSDFLDTALPFSIPQKLNLVNYYLVVPKRFLEAEKMFSESVHAKLPIKMNTSQLPIFRSSISSGLPLMVFFFDDEQETENKFPIMTINNYLSTDKKKTSVSSFFDMIAKHWVQKSDINALISSVFCRTSNYDSFCLRIPNSSFLQLLPFKYKWSESQLQKRGVRNVIGKLLKEEDPYDSDDDENDSPRSILGLSEKISSIQNKLKSTLGLETDDDDEDFDGSYSESSFIDENYEWGRLEKRDFSEDNNFYNLPLALLTVKDTEIDSPRGLHYSQVQQYMVSNSTKELKYSILSSKKECEPVTWFNIFHHAIFGKANFCPPKVES